MRKESVIFIFLLALFIFGCAEPYPNEVVDVGEQPIEPRAAEQKIVEDTLIIEVTTTLQKPIVVPEKTDETKFKIFNPRLTYPGAYNGPLYGTSEQVGSASMEPYFENLDRNGINFFIGMFGISGEPNIAALTNDQGLGKIIYAAQKHPGRIIPFFNPGIGGEEVKKYLGNELTAMYRNTLTASQKVAGKDFIRGFGEVETQEWGVRHNDEKVLQLVDLAKSNNINFMYHPVAGKVEDIAKLAEAYPNMNFIIHMYREDLDNSMPDLIKILKEHDNVYYSIDAAHIIHIDGDAIYDFDSRNKQNSINKFVSYYDGKEDLIIGNAIKAYKPLVDAVPDKVMWGTEMGPEYSFDAEVFDRAIKASRFVIAGFNKEHWEGVGYKNALRAFGEGVIVDSNIEVLDTSSWVECTDSQMEECDDICETPDDDVSMTPEQDVCFINCLKEKKCVEVPEMDVG